MGEELVRLTIPGARLERFVPPNGMHSLNGFARATASEIVYCSAKGEGLLLPSVLKNSREMKRNRRKIRMKTRLAHSEFCAVENNVLVGSHIL